MSTVRVPVKRSKSWVQGADEKEWVGSDILRFNILGTNIILANSLEVAMPIGHILVGDTRRDVEHDHTTLALNIEYLNTTILFPYFGLRLQSPCY